MTTALKTFVLALLLMTAWAHAESPGKPGQADEMYEVGKAYANASKGTQDDELAVHWFMRAAYLGQFHAMHHLAQLYWSGRGVVADLPRAHAWASIASDWIANDLNEQLGPRPRTAAYARLPAQIGREMTPAQLESARALKVTLLKEIHSAP